MEPCVSVRVVVADFTPSRSQRRGWKRHHDLQIDILPLQDKPEYFELYQRYQQTRHSEGGMKDDGPEQYRNFLLQSHVDSLLVEFREGEAGLRGACPGGATWRAAFFAQRSEIICPYK